jgi:leucyl/phenylalanyl-tRNA--protein transferase
VLRLLAPGEPFPPVTAALRRPNGLLAAGADLAPGTLLAAYRQGIFPWYAAGEPVLWWSPDPRMVLFVDEFRVSRSLAKNARNRGYETRADTCFEAVIDGCAGPRRGEPGTWIGADMRRAYVRLHRLGHAHSIETWHGGRLVGGLYGVSIGRMFYGESMFSRATDASKVALLALVRELARRGAPLVDCQQHTALLASLGAREIARGEFLRRLAPLVNYPEPPGNWTLEATNLVPT